MSVGIHQALRWRTGAAAARIPFQMAVRAILLAVLRWVLMTWGLVWYWTEYYGGPRRTNTLAEGFSWFFTQGLPL